MVPADRPDRPDRPGPRALVRTLPDRVASGLRAAAGRVRPRSTGWQWQHRRLEGTEQRWTLISQALSSNDRSLLDIGCNAGLLTARAADAGLVAVGIDANVDAIVSARHAFADRPRLGFMVHRVDAEDIGRLPRFDVVLLLSVYHQWVADAGNDVAEQMLADVVGVAHHRLLFETAGVTRKYGDHVPPELAADGTVEYVTDLLERVAPAAARVRHLGATATPDEDEVVRHLFVVDLCAAAGDRPPLQR